MIYSHVSIELSHGGELQINNVILNILIAMRQQVIRNVEFVSQFVFPLDYHVQNCPFHKSQIFQKGWLLACFPLMAVGIQCKRGNGKHPYFSWLYVILDRAALASVTLWPSQRELGALLRDGIGGAGEIVQRVNCLPGFNSQYHGRPWFNPWQHRWFLKLCQEWLLSTESAVSSKHSWVLLKNKINK